MDPQSFSFDAEAPYPTSTGRANTGSALIDADVMTRGFQLHHIGRAGCVRWALVVLGVFAAGFSALTFVQGPPVVSATAAVLALFVWISALGGYRLHRRQFERQLREMGKEQEAVVYEVTPDHLRICTDESDVRVPWARFVKWKEGDGLILVYRHRQFFYVIPTDQFDDDLADAIREHLRAHVGG